MKHWDGNTDVECPEIDAFLADIDAVCRKHGFSISHEDGHGGFQIEPYEDFYREWLSHASFGEGLRHSQPTPQETANAQPS